MQIIKEETNRHFEIVYIKDNDVDRESFRTMLDHIPNLISVGDNEELGMDIAEMEILNAIWGLVLDKAPGSEHFQLFF